MQSANDIFGASACIRIKFTGSLEHLASTLAKALHLRDFEVETEEYPPYAQMASAEGMGWEAWLQVIPENPPLFFKFRMATENCAEAVVHGRMYDLSPWLANLITTLCDLECHPA